MNAFIERIEKRLEYIREQKRIAHSEFLEGIFQTEAHTLELVINDYIWKQESKNDG